MSGTDDWKEFGKKSFTDFLESRKSEDMVNILPEVQFEVKDSKELLDPLLNLFLKKSDANWIDEMISVTKKYNHTKHSLTKLTPSVFIEEWGYCLHKLIRQNKLYENEILNWRFR